MANQIGTFQFTERFRAIQQRVEQARLQMMLAEAEVTTHEEIKPTIETWNQWSEMIQQHHKLIKVYNDALLDWSDLYGAKYKILPLKLDPAKCPKCHEPYGTVANCVPGRCGDSLTPVVEELFEKPQ